MDLRADCRQGEPGSGVDHLVVEPPTVGNRSRASKVTPEPRAHDGYEWIYVLSGHMRFVLVGYVRHLTGAIPEIFGIHISPILLIPGGLFELAFGVWLVIKGFQPEAYGQDAGSPAKKQFLLTP